MAASPIALANCSRLRGIPVTPKNPNVLVILTDQLRYDVFSHMGDKIVETPNIDQLAAGGVVMTDAICSSPLCGPSRASLLSGCFGFDGKYTFKNCEPGKPGPWKEEITTVDEALDQAGFHVEYHGKWHTGQGHLDCYKKADIFGHHISAYESYLAGKYERPAKDGEHKACRYTRWPYRFWPIDEMMANAKKSGVPMPHHNEAGVIDVDPEDTLTAWTAKKTVRFLQSKPQTPFAVTCSILHPHAPLVACERYATMFDPADMPMPPNVNHSLDEKAPIPDAVPADDSGLGQFIALYYGLVKELDDWAGKLLDALDESGCADDTLVVFTADHGELMGGHRTFSKMRFYEECLRVPLIFRYPNGISAGQRLRAPASGADVAPTILDYCNVPQLEQFHGKSLRPVMEGADPEDDFAFSECRDRQCLRSTKWKSIVWPGRPDELYDLENDPYEMRNLLAEAEITGEAKKMKTELDARMESEFRFTGPKED